MCVVCAYPDLSCYFQGHCVTEMTWHFSAAINLGSLRQCGNVDSLSAPSSFVCFCCCVLHLFFFFSRAFCLSSTPFSSLCCLSRMCLYAPLGTDQLGPPYWILERFSLWVFTPADTHRWIHAWREERKAGGEKKSDRKGGREGAERESLQKNMLIQFHLFHYVCIYI